MNARHLSAIADIKIPLCIRFLDTPVVTGIAKLEWTVVVTPPFVRPG
jgi:hypothetical protein